MAESEPNSEIVQFTLQQTCRTCLQNITVYDGENMVDIFDAKNSKQSSTQLLQDGLLMFKLQVSQNDGLPQKLCHQCLQRFRNISAFQKICQQSQHILLQYFIHSKTSIDNPTAESRQICDEEKTIIDIQVAEEYSADFEFFNIEHNITTENVQFIDSKVQIQVVDHHPNKPTNHIFDQNELTPNSRSGGVILAGDKTVDNHSNDNNDDFIDTECDEDNWQETTVQNERIRSNDVRKDKVNKTECHICGKVYKREALLLRHIASHKSNEADNTTGCGKQFSKSKAMQQHQAIEEENLKCRFCKELFEKKCDLEVHLQQMHPRDRPHMCPVCKKTFQSVSNRNTHLQSHNKEGSYKCDVCDQGFKSKVYLSKHRKSVHTVSMHDCPHCLLKFDNATKYEYHLKSHDPNKKYKCKYCDKSFLQHHHLANHERTHTNNRPYLCNICGKDFKQECNFKLHLKTHSGIRPYVCSVCGKDFIQRNSFVMHMRRHSGARPYQCEMCGKGFIQKSSLTVHLRTHTGERPYKCDSCDKAFVQAQQLRYHRYSAHGGPAIIKKEQPAKPSSNGRIYPYCCPICNKGFKLPPSLSNHMKIHNEVRKHVCTQCGNSFKRAEHLRIHINAVHLKQKPYACTVCSKTFSQAGDRNIHMRRHTGEKPHQCPHCQKCFRLLKAQRAHIRIHTGEKPYVCEFCQASFMTYTALATHTIKHEIAQRTLNAATVLNDLKEDKADTNNEQTSETLKAITVEDVKPSFLTLGTTNTSATADDLVISTVNL